MSKDVSEALLHSVKKNKFYKVKGLLEQKADPNSIDEEGKSALYHAAIGQQNIDMTELLLQYGANPNAWEKTITSKSTSFLSLIGRETKNTIKVDPLLPEALGYGYKPIAELLIKKGANPFTSEISYKLALTAIHQAVFKRLGLPNLSALSEQGSAGLGLLNSVGKHEFISSIPEELETLKNIDKVDWKNAFMTAAFNVLSYGCTMIQMQRDFSPLCRAHYQDAALSLFTEKEETLPEMERRKRKLEIETEEEVNVSPSTKKTHTELVTTPSAPPAEPSQKL